MKRVFKITRQMTCIDTYPTWEIKELKRTKEYDHGAIFSPYDGYTSVIIVSDYTTTKSGNSILNMLPEPSILGNVFAWGSSLIMEAVDREQCNNIWRDELGKVQLSRRG